MVFIIHITVKTYLSYLFLVYLLNSPQLEYKFHVNRDISALLLLHYQLLEEGLLYIDNCTFLLNKERHE